MSIDRSLHVGGGLARHRNVLNRAERITKLSATGKFDPKTGDPLGLPKVANRKVVAKTEKKVKVADGTEAVAGAPGAAAPVAAAPAAPAGKGAAAKPAAGAKPAAKPAGKGK